MDDEYIKLNFSNKISSDISSSSGIPTTAAMVPSLDTAGSAKPATSPHVVATNLDFVRNNGCITPSDMLNYGLERSLNTTSHSDKSILDLLPGGATQDTTRNLTRNRLEKFVSGTGTTSNASFVAIDSKIEQAMDLVKTHLMFAVREEVETLRSRILELEATVLQLDAENAILREHIPAEILNKINLQLSQPKTAAAAVQ
ncbi:unnamed protein product [Enterobius vermicularis]|uniref:TSC22 domain family protein 1 n=1 Tax=Enterobius vermicularis TaxID=51028 RepID=A0A0N4UYV1_ENTVE|nr:unnamed protein product [Enterobius vermicularis]